MNKIKINDGLKVNVLKPEQLKELKDSNRKKDNEVYVLDDETIINQANDITELKNTRQVNLKPDETIILDSKGNIKANIDLSDYYNKQTSNKLFISRDESAELINEAITGLVDGISSSNNLQLDRNGNKLQLRVTIPYSENDKSVALGSPLGKGSSFGKNTNAAGENSVAIGSGSIATQANEFSIGNDSVKRTITHVAEGVENSDAVTVSQLKTEVSKLMSKLNDMDNKLNDTANKLYPIGSVYISVNDVNPEKFLGGKWQKLDDGRLLMNSGNGFNLGSTGGSKTKNILEANMPSHNHHIDTRSENIWGKFPLDDDLWEYRKDGFGGAFSVDTGSHRNGTAPGDQDEGSYIVNFNASVRINANTNNKGGNQPLDIMPPYLVVTMWKRIQ